MFWRYDAAPDGVRAGTISYVRRRESSPALKMSLIRSMLLCAALGLASAATVSDSSASSPASPRPAIEDLGAAIDAGDLARVKSIIATGLDVNTPVGGVTVLMKAAALQEIDAVRMLLAAHANVNARSADGETALLLSFIKGDLKIYSTMLGQGLARQAIGSMFGGALSPEEEEKLAAERRQAYVEAAKSDNVDLVRTLLAAKADVNAADSKGNTALSKASYHGNAEIVTILLMAGADVDAKDESGSTALMDAVLGGESVAVVGTLVAAGNADVNATKSDDGSTALIYAATGDSVELVKALLSAKAEINAKRHDGFTALMVAAESGKTEIVGLLLSAKANPNAKGMNGETALSLASKNGHAPVASLLKRAGAK